MLNEVEVTDGGPHAPYTQIMRDKLRQSLLGPLAALLMIALMPGCDGNSPTASTLPEGDVPYEVLFSSQESGITDFRRAVIRVDADLQTLWTELGTRAEVPMIDFNFDMVIAVASGEQPNGCYTIEVTGAVSDGTDLTVTVTEQTPTAVCACTDVVVNPVEVIRLPRANGVTFNNLTVATCAS